MEKLCYSIFKGEESGVKNNTYVLIFYTAVCAAGSTNSNCHRVEIEIQFAISPAIKNACGMEITMSEREKMLNGQWHDANFDENLIQERRKAELLCYDFNMSKPGSGEQIAALTDLLGTEIEDGVTVLAPAYFDYGIYTSFGKGTFVNHGCYFMDGGRINIGENVFIGPFCGFYTASHPMNYADRNKGLEKALPITVGDNCWFGANVSVLQGVTIGSGCVIAAGSVVTEDVPDNCMVAGVPARVKKYINQEESIEQ